MIKYIMYMLHVDIYIYINIDHLIIIQYVYIYTYIHVFLLGPASSHITGFQCLVSASPTPVAHDFGHPSRITCLVVGMGRKIEASRNGC